MKHADDMVVIIHVCEATHPGSIGKSHIDDSLFMMTIICHFFCGQH